MKKHQFLHFLAKTGIVSVIAVSMVCTTLHPTFALSDTSATESDEPKTTVTETPVSEEAAESPVVSNEPAAVTPVTEPTPEAKPEATPETTPEVKPETEPEATPEEDNTDKPTNSDHPDEADKPDITDDSQAPAADPDNQDKKNPDNQGEQIQDEQIQDEQDQDEQDADKTDIDKRPSNKDDVSEDTDSKGTDSKGTNPKDTGSKITISKNHASKNAKVNTSTQSEKATSAKTVIEDKSPDAVYVKSDFNPSEIFVDIEDRVKYNTALPLDNIPSFITQEMIIGALKCQDETGFPASVTIAQIIQESGYGKYGPGGDEHQGLSYLAYEYCNLFGIKGVGTAGTVNMRTGEQTASGSYYSTTAGFRVYNTYTECIEDRCDLLQRVYGDLIEGVTDANTFAMRIGSRWATSLQYSQHLIQQMERYDLYRLDEMTLLDFGEMIGRFADPCPGSYVTSPFGYRKFDQKFHKGIDLGTGGEPIPVYAAESGTVVRAEFDNLAGNWVMIDHGNGIVTKYMHFSHTFVKVGQEVTKGQQIGLTGTTGRSTGVHLHFQVEENGVAVDPTTYFTPMDTVDQQLN